MASFLMRVSKLREHLQGIGEPIIDSEVTVCSKCIAIRMERLCNKCLLQEGFNCL